MTKEQANRWLYRIYRMLKVTDLKMRLNRKLGKLFGITTIYAHGKDDALMEIDPEKKEFMSTLVHECLHLVDWNLKEEQVGDLEVEIMDNLSDRQLMNLLKRIIIYHTKE